MGPRWSADAPGAVYATMGEELARAHKERTVGKAATRLNYAKGGMRSLMSKSARKIAQVQVGPFMEGKWKEKFLEIDKKWGDREIWTTIKHAGDRYTIAYYLKAIDLRYDWDKSITVEAENASSTC